MKILANVLVLSVMVGTGASGVNFEILDPRINEISPLNSDRLQEDSICVGNSICSFLQANDKGVNVVRYCNCPGGEECPVQWDPYDGKSVTQLKSNQYKYCHASPPVQKCRSTTEVAYVSVQKYSKLTGKKVTNKDTVECMCLEGQNYLVSKMEDFKEMEDELYQTLVIFYFCLPLPPCNETEFCKTIVAKPGEYISSPNCLCQGENSACPTVTETGIERTSFMGSELQKIRCQKPTSRGKHPILGLLQRYWLQTSVDKRDLAVNRYFNII